MGSDASASAPRRGRLSLGAAELLEERVAHRIEVEPVLGDQRARLDDDVVDVPDHLEALIEILHTEAEPLAEDLHEIDDLEAAPVANIAELAVAGMVNRGERRHASVGHCGELARNELADRLSKLGALNGAIDSIELLTTEAPTLEVPPDLVGLEPRGEWEREFLRSVADQLRRNRPLSPKQQAVIDRIRARPSMQS